MTRMNTNEAQQAFHFFREQYRWGHLSHTSEAEIDAAMAEDGLYFYRHSFRWGTTPAYRNTKRTTFRFVDRGDILTPAQLLARLLDEWRPVAAADVTYACYTMRRELEALQARETGE